MMRDCAGRGPGRHLMSAGGDGLDQLSEIAERGALLHRRAANDAPKRPLAGAAAPPSGAPTYNHNTLHAVKF